MSQVERYHRRNALDLRFSQSAQDGKNTIFELVLLVLKDGVDTSDEFESAFSKAKMILEDASGYRSHCLARCLEASRHYALIVEWESLTHHIGDFRHSAAYPQWRELLGHYVEPEVWVRHFTPVVKNAV